MTSDFLQVTTHGLWIDGRGIQITAQQVANSNPPALQLTWNLPTTTHAYDGAVVLLSEQRLEGGDFPVDGTRYIGSTAWGSPANMPGRQGMQGRAQVVAAFYGYFGDNTQQTSVTVTGIDPNKVYFASIHAASNVLQYFTTGSQSYPLEASRIQKRDGAFTGSIPASVTPPENPYNGQVYYDPRSNVVLVWNDGQSAWIEAGESSVQTGEQPEIDLYKLFYNSTTNTLKFFDGTQWQAAGPYNLRVKMGATWIPFAGSSNMPTYPTNPVPGQFVYSVLPAQLSAPQTAQLKFFSLGSWWYPEPNLVQVNVGDGVWHPIVSSDVIPSSSTLTGSLNSNLADPQIPNVGDFFYNSSTRHLMVWTGSTWTRADTAEPGTPMTSKLGVGTDGSYDERLQLTKTLKNLLGSPAVCVEVGEDSFNTAIDNALKMFRQRADNAYTLAYVSYTITGGVSDYYLNDPRDKTNTIVNVLKIHRINQLGISSLSSETGLYAQAFFNQLYQGSNVDVLSIHLMNQLSKLYEKIFAGNLMFTWDEPKRLLKILRRTLQPQERVLLEVVMEKTEQELLFDRWAGIWIQQWAYAELMEMLGNVRSKYQSGLPSSQGGLSLNGADLLARASTLKQELQRQINDYEVGNGGVEHLNTSVFIG
jgi:hypothetical protein